MRERASGGASRGSLDLIHRNNSPKPISMRVCGHLRPAVQALRWAVYRPLACVAMLPLGPVRYIAVIRSVVAITERVDRPLRRMVIEWGAYGTE